MKNLSIISVMLLLLFTSCNDPQQDEHADVKAFEQSAQSAAEMITKA